MTLATRQQQDDQQRADLKSARRKKLLPEPIRTDRQPPHSIEAEQGVLGAILLSPNDNMGECIEKFKSGHEVFYDLRHQTVYEVLLELYEAKKPIDLITVQQRLKDKQQLEAIGGFGYLASLPDLSGTAGHIGSYAQIVWEKYILRKMIRTCSDVLGRVYEHEGQVDVLLDEVETDILSLGNERINTNTVKINDAVQRAMDSIESYHQHKGHKDGLTTGFHRLDHVLISGLCGSKVIVLAARPSEGKTTLGMNICEHVAIDCQKPVGVFSLEMDADELIMRSICSRASINFEDIAKGTLTQFDFNSIAKHAGAIRRAPIHIDDTGGLTIMQIKARARRMAQKFGVKLIVVDYLQLISGSKKRGDSNRQQEISDISNGMKSLAKELKIPILLLAQLNRAIEKDKGRRPRLSDLRESGAIEQDADIVLMPYNPKPPKDDDEEEPDELPMKIFVAKQRGGPRNRFVDVIFQKRFTRFETPKPASHDE